MAKYFVGLGARPTFALCTPISQAIRSNQLELAQWMIERTPRVHFKIYKLACNGGLLELVQLVVHKVVEAFPGEFTPHLAVGVAVQGGHISVVEWVIAQYPDYDPNPAEYARVAVNHKYYDLAKWLIAHGHAAPFDVNACAAYIKKHGKKRYIADNLAGLI